MTSLTFYGGVNEIGGNKVLVEDRDVRVFLDFGQPFNMGSDYFAGWLCPRATNGVGDYFEFNLLPRLKGLYAKEQLQFMDLPYEVPRFDAVFLSDRSIDHVTSSSNHVLRVLSDHQRIFAGSCRILPCTIGYRSSRFCLCVPILMPLFSHPHSFRKLDP